MEPVKTAVETPVQPAAPVQPAVETPAPPAAPAPQDDLEAKLAAKDAEIARLATEKENYRLGLLKAKGKLPDDPTPPDDQQPDIDFLVTQKVHEALYSEQEKKLQVEKEQILQQALKENKELKIAIAAKGGMSGAPDGPPADDKTTTPQYFTPEQIKEFKNRGWDDAKIKKAAENMQNRR